MKTITFYSYKGGVGRSLALSNVAMRLSEFNKKVCIIDFDIEAPGIQFKFKNFSRPITINRGLVDYVYEFSCEGKISNNIKDYVTQLRPKNSVFKPIDIIAAGNIDDMNYWKKLSSIKWAEMFYDENGQGLRFFLDLKAKIQKQLNPDFLLIDSRTGITDISGITLKLLADEIVVFAANNEENIDGCKKVIKNLLDPSNSILKTPKIKFLLTRLPFTGEQEDRNKEYIIVERRKQEFKKYLGVENFDIAVIHSDRRLEEDEIQLIGYEYENTVSVSNDYLKLFDMLTIDALSNDEVTEFKNTRIAEKEYSKSKMEKENSFKIQHLNRAIELNPNKYEYYADRGVAYFHVGKFEDSIKDLKQAAQLNSFNHILLNNIAIVYARLGNFDESNSYVNEALKLDHNYVEAYLRKYSNLISQKKYDDAKNILNYILEHIDPNNDIVLNSRADLNRKLGDNNSAYNDIRKAIEINPDRAIYLATLAEIFATEDKKNEFYLYLSLALSKGIKTKELRSAKEVYEKFRYDEKFLALTDKHGLDIEEIFVDSED